MSIAIQYADNMMGLTPGPVETLYVPQYYRDPEGHWKAKVTLDRDAHVALAASIAHEMTGLTKYWVLVQRILDSWARTLTEVKGSEAKLVLVYEGQRFLDAYLRFKMSATFHHPIFEQWIREVYNPCAVWLAKYPDNKGAWGWLGQVLARKCVGADLRETARLLERHLTHDKDAYGMIWREAKRKTDWLWYHHQYQFQRSRRTDRLHSGRCIPVFHAD